MAQNNFHVVKVDRGWGVKQEGNPNPISIHQTQEQAIQSGRPLAQAYQGELVIHGQDGRIRDKDSFGPDPCPPHDKKH